MKYYILTRYIFFADMRLKRLNFIINNVMRGNYHEIMQADDIQIALAQGQQDKAKLHSD